MKVAFARLYAYLRARLAEPSTHAGLAAFLAAVAGGVDLVGSREAAIGLLVSAGLAGLKAAMMADPHLAAEVGEAVAIESAAAPVATALASAMLPAHSARLAALEAQIAALNAAVVPAKTDSAA